MTDTLDTSAPLTTAASNPYALTNSSFQHMQSAHCESGVAAGLLSHYGLPMTEPMAFGLSGALTFAYIPLIKLFGMPMIAYRMPPKAIIKGIKKRLGIDIEFKTFRNPEAGMQELDKLLAANKAVGLQTNVYWLPYFPPEMRFHFNGHNLIVFAKQNGEYHISDPVFETALRCDAEGLKKARFAKGALESKGLMYYPTQMPSDINYQKAIPAAIRANYKNMMAPIPFIGIRGIRYLGKQLVKLGQDPAKRDKHLRLYLGHIVRMQEEIGTGGAGFRFIYAAFLNQAAQHFEKDLLLEASKAMTHAGDHWRVFALEASKMIRDRKPMDVLQLQAIVNECADKELAVWQMLKPIGR